MRFENNGNALWFAADKNSSDAQGLPASTKLTLTVAVQPINPANNVEILYKRSGSSNVKALRARWKRNDYAKNIQYFTATLLAADCSGDCSETVKYTAVCYRAGRRILGRPEKDDSWVSFSPEPIPINEVAFQVSARLMDDYRVSKSITGESAIVVASDQTGAAQILALDNNGTVFNIHPSEESDTGWEQIPLQNNFTATALAIASATSLTVAFAIGIDEANPEIHFAVHLGGNDWGKWTQIPVDPNLPPGMPAARLLAANVGGKVRLFAFLQGGPFSYQPYSLWSVPWDNSRASWQLMGTVAGTLGEVTKFKAYGAGILASALAQSDPSAFDLLLFPFAAPSSPVTVLPATKFSKATAGMHANGYSGVFLYNDGWISGKQNISYVDGSSATPTAVVIDTSTACLSIQAVDAAQNPLMLMLLNTQNQLMVVHQRSSGAAWREPFLLGDQLQSMIQVKDSQNQTGILAFSLKDDLLCQITQSGARADNPGAWLKEEIDLPVDQVRQVSTYCTEVTITKADGNFLPDQPIEIYAGEVIEAMVAGQSVVLGALYQKPLNQPTFATSADSVPKVGSMPNSNML